MFDTGPADRAIAKSDRVVAALESAEMDVAAAVERLVDRLCDEGVIRIHRAWSANEERKLIREAATKAAIKSVLTNDWMGDLPREVIQLWPEEAQP